MTEQTAAIISVHPDFAEAIVAREKTVELRRRIPWLPVGATLWVYATLPVGAIIGAVTVKEIEKSSPLAIWSKYADMTGIDFVRFRAYFAGTEQAVAIMLENARRCHPVGIAALRKVRHGFHPPQVITKISTQEAIAIEQLAKKA